MDLCPKSILLMRSNIVRNVSRMLLNVGPKWRAPLCAQCVSTDTHSMAKGEDKILDFPDMGPSIPEQKERTGESLDRKRARLLYQSRKRGISENGLLLSTFASKYLHNFDEKMLNDYDTLINKPSNDWELYYWITEKKPTPLKFDNKIMDMLKTHARNENMETRYRMPDLDEKTTPTSS